MPSEIGRLGTKKAVQESAAAQVKVVAERSGGVANSWERLYAKDVVPSAN